MIQDNFFKRDSEFIGQSNSNLNKIICADNPVVVYVVYGILFVYLLFSLWVIYYFYKKRKLFPIRGRSPTKAMHQAFLLWMLLVIPFVTDIFAFYGYLDNWGYEITFSRRLIKSTYFSIRVTSIMIFLIRSLHVHYIWTKDKQNRETVLFLQKYNIPLLVQICQLLIFIAIFYVLSDYYMTQIPLFDWYLGPSYDVYLSYIFNFTWLHIFEQIVLFLGVLLNMSYPPECGMLNEMISFNLIVFFYNCFYEYIEMALDNSCFAGLIIDIWGNIMRNTLFQVISLIIPIRIASNLFPLPFTWIFRDFKNFLFDQYCFEIFEAYLITNESEVYNSLENIMKLYLMQSQKTNEKRKNSMFWYEGEWRVSRTQRKKEIVDQSTGVFKSDFEILKESYVRYKKTISYLALRSKVSNFQKLTEKHYGL